VRHVLAGLSVVVMFGLVAVPPAAAQRSARGTVTAPVDEPVPGLRGFNVALVQGDLQAGTAVGDTVPAVAAKALADLKDFLPYKSYRLLDTQWTIGSGRMTGRLRGSDGREYDLELLARKGSAAEVPLTVTRFVLRDVSTKPTETRMATLFQKGLITQSAAQRGSRGTTSGGTVVLGRAHSVIDTSFNMNLGETVVVGTSRLKGDTALIVLLTAVSQPSAPAKR
jgi:hypothetical protein